jgi:hypothetical protein
VIVGVKMPFMLSLKKFEPSGVCEVGKKIISIKKLLSKLFLGLKKVITFALTVLATQRSERAAYQGESFVFLVFPPILIHSLCLFCSLRKHTKGVFSFVCIPTI